MNRMSGICKSPWAPTPAPAALSPGANGCIHPLADSRRTRSGDGGRSQRTRSMTVLVTGGAGYIGSHMVHALVDGGERVVVLDNLTTGFDWALAPAASLVVGDAGDQARVAALIAEFGVDAVIHFAASI